MHFFVWGSIVSWFVVIPITSTGLFYSDFFRYNAVANQVLSTATFWFYWPLAAFAALLPTVVFRMLRLDLSPKLVDDVRLKQHAEGRHLFKRKILLRGTKTKRKETFVRRSGYAFSQEPGFADLICTGRGFGLSAENIEQQRNEYMNTWRSSRPSSRAVTPPPPSSRFPGDGDRAHLEPREPKTADETGHPPHVPTGVSPDQATEGKVHATPTPTPPGPLDWEVDVTVVPAKGREGDLS